MRPKLPAPVLHADAIHHQILERVAFSRHLNPRNSAEARAAFLRGQAEPRFDYEPLAEADEILRQLDAADPPRDHPAGALIGACMDSTAALVRALRDRSAAAFDALARAEDWYPSAADLAMQLPDAAEAAPDPADVSAERLIQALRQALRERGLEGWRVEPDSVMAARVLVDGAKRLLRVHPHARFRGRDLARLVVHEVDVHALRAANGEGQILRCFETGLPHSLATEEGLAMVAEERSGTATPGGLARQIWVLRAIDLAKETGFREVFDMLRASVGNEMAWGVCLRIKRGLANPGAPGVYAKDSVYLRGWAALRAWLDAGGDLAHLYVGKVSIASPVGAWLQQGWVRPSPVPAFWFSLPESARSSPEIPPP